MISPKTGWLARALVVGLLGCAPVVPPSQPADATLDTWVDTGAADLSPPCPLGSTDACRVCTVTGWQDGPADTPCDDGSACTFSDHCQGGTCVGGPAKDCDDHTPCTQDACDPAKGCVWLPVAATCTDDNPCTVNEHCDGGECKFDGKPCDDDNPCTTNGCDKKSGACTFVNNDHEHCRPAFQLTFPPHGLQWVSPTPVMKVGGKVHSDAGTIQQVTLAGQTTAVAADGSFQADVTLQWGPNVLVIQAVDATGGQGQAVRAVVWSPEWTPVGPQGAVVPDGLQVVAGPGAKGPTAADVWLPKALAVTAPLTGQPVAVQLAGAATSTGGAVQVAVTSAVTGFAGSPGVPKRKACQDAGVQPEAQPGTTTAVWRHDLLNAVLWAAWRAGAYEGGLPVLENDPVFKPFSPKVLASATLPPLLADCPGLGSRVHVGDLRVHLDFLDKDKKPNQGDLWISFDAPVTVACKGGELRLVAGDLDNLQMEVNSTQAESDFAVQAANYANLKAVTDLWVVWTETPLLRWPLPAGWVPAVCAEEPGGVRSQGP